MLTCFGGTTIISAAEWYFSGITGSISNFFHRIASPHLSSAQQLSSAAQLSSSAAGHSKVLRGHLTPRWLEGVTRGALDIRQKKRCHTVSHRVTPAVLQDIAELALYHSLPYFQPVGSFACFSSDAIIVSRYIIDHLRSFVYIYGSSTCIPVM